VLLAALIARVPVLANDDTYIYFNYARNLVAGHPFAYDSRGIPSEGFTSLLYLLLLVPFEAAGIDMMLAACSLNLVAVVAVVGLVVLLARLDGLVEKRYLGLLAALFLACLTLDDNVVVVIGRALETMLGPATVFLAIVFLTLAARTDRPVGGRRWAAWGFFAAVFLSFLTRPESLVPLALCGLLLLAQDPSRKGLRAVLPPGVAFILGLGAYHVAKALVFGDVFPTGYYRKMSFEGTGVQYVRAAVAAYAGWLAALAVAISALCVVLRLRGDRPRDLVRPSTAALLLAGSGALLAALPLEPLIGYAYRYVATFYVALYALFSLAVVVLVQSILGRRSGGLVPDLVAGALTVLIAGGTLQVTASRQGLSSPADWRAAVDLPERAREATGSHRYLQLGRFLRARLPDHERITMVFGDAGALPYAFHSRFVDANGLTEAYLAHLFQVPNGPEKARRYADYVLSWQPDIIVLGFGAADPNGVWYSPPNMHSPFRGPTPIDVFEAYRAFGIEYVCTAHAYYDLHFGVRRSSPDFEPIVAALLDYCGARGYALPGGLTIALAARSVHFPAVPISGGAPPAADGIGPGG